MCLIIIITFACSSNVQMITSLDYQDHGSHIGIQKIRDSIVGAKKNRRKTTEMSNCITYFPLRATCEMVLSSYSEMCRIPNGEHRVPVVFPAHHGAAFCRRTPYEVFLGYFMPIAFGMTSLLARLCPRKKEYVRTTQCIIAHTEM